MIEALIVSSLTGILTVAIHMVGLGTLMAFMQARSGHFRPYRNLWRQAAFIMAIVLGLFIVHAIEIWSYAFVYLLLGAFDDLETAVYFSTSTFTTLGYGDVVIDSQWRIVAAIEGFNGFLLIGWSTAFLVTVIGRLRSVEFDWLEHLREDDED